MPKDKDLSEVVQTLIARINNMEQKNRVNEQKLEMYERDNSELKEANQNLTRHIEQIEHLMSV